MDEKSEKPPFAFFVHRDQSSLDYGGPEFFVEAVPIKSWGKRCKLAYSTPTNADRVFIDKGCVCLTPEEAIRKAIDQTKSRISRLRRDLEEAEELMAALGTNLPVKFPKRRR